MAIVNKLKLTKDTKTCKDLKNLFLERILMEPQGFSEIRLDFDRYVESSLKERTRERGISGKSTRYIVSDSTGKLSDFCDRTISALENMGKNFVVVTKSVSNIAGYPEALLQHSQEEGNQHLLVYTF